MFIYRYLVLAGALAAAGAAIMRMHSNNTNITIFMYIYQISKEEAHFFWRLFGVCVFCTFSKKQTAIYIEREMEYISYLSVLM